MSPRTVVFPADPQQIVRALGIRDPRVREQISATVARAVGTRHPCVTLWRGADDSVGRLITVRPARESDHVVVTIETLDAGRTGLSSTHLTELFGLSRSEADIALALMMDESPATIAEFRRVQLETVRGQIKTILRKVGISSQKQLIRVLSQVSAAIS